MEVINFLLFHSLSPFTLQTIFIATSSFALQSHEILGLILELFLWKLMAVSRPIHSGLTISFTRNISLCLLHFFQVFVINTGFFKAIGTKGYPNIGLLRCGWMRLGANTDGLLFASSLIMFNNITRERPIVALIHTISSLRKSLCVITIRIALYEALHNKYDSKANSHRYTICGHFLHKKEQQCFNNNFAQPC